MKNIPKKDEFFVVNGGTDPQTFEITQLIAEKQGLVATQHPINPGEFLVHQPNANLKLRTSAKLDGVPFGSKNAVQFFMQNTQQEEEFRIKDR